MRTSPDRLCDEGCVAPRVLRTPQRRKLRVRGASRVPPRGFEPTMLCARSACVDQVAEQLNPPAMSVSWPTSPRAERVVSKRSEANAVERGKFRRPQEVGHPDRGVAARDRGARHAGEGNSRGRRPGVGRAHVISIEPATRGALAAPTRCGPFRTATRHSTDERPMAGRARESRAGPGGGEPRKPSIGLEPMTPSMVSVLAEEIAV